MAVPDADPVFYFAYGSNADPRRFRERVGPWRSRRAAQLPDHRLRFAASVQSEGGGGAVVDPDPGGRVDGVLYEITAEQLAAMDAEEFDPQRDTKRLGRREQTQVQVDGRAVQAELYSVDDDGAWSPPSERYLGFILCGLRDAGHPMEALDRVRRVADRARARSGTSGP